MALKCGPLNRVGKELDSAFYRVTKNVDGIHGMLTKAKGLGVCAHVFGVTDDAEVRTVSCRLESHVIKEVRDAIVRRCDGSAVGKLSRRKTRAGRWWAVCIVCARAPTGFAPGTGLENDTHRRHLTVVLFARHPQAVRKRRYLRARSLAGSM